ncbi:MAG: ATP-binding cassette domain-containing protein [Herpetosiphon sp.]
MALIEVDQLCRSFVTRVRGVGRWSRLRSLVAPEHRRVAAVSNIGFHIEAGSMVGYIGPNGAGKSTTMKMLTGILHPTSGTVVVDGLIPYRQRVEHVRRIGVVFGQRTQLWWDLPTIESFELLRHIYRVPFDRWHENMRLFRDLLELDAFLQTPVRQLSLGQRMRADLAAALLHDPRILFLDEPTIGLDVVARERIRQFLLHVNREEGVTVMLTTHDLLDIERLCPRVMLIDQGQLVFDGLLEALRQQYGRWRTLVIELETAVEPMVVPGAEVVRQEGNRIALRFDRELFTAAALIAWVVERYPVRDLTVEEPAIETVIHDLYVAGDYGSMDGNDRASSSDPRGED